MPKNAPFPVELVARVLAARAMNIPYRTISEATGVPCCTIKDWVIERTRVGVKPDLEFRERFKGLFR